MDITVILLLVIVIFLFYKMGKKQYVDPEIEEDASVKNKETFLLNQKQNPIYKKNIYNKNHKDKKRVGIMDEVMYDMPNNGSDDVTTGENETSLGSNGSGRWMNPLNNNIDPYRNNIEGVDQSALDALIREVNVGNSIPSNTNNAKLFKKRVQSIDSAKDGYRKINYKDSNYRMDFNGDGISKLSQDQLDKLYSDALIFHDSEYQNNSNFTGVSEDDMSEYANAGVKPESPETQKDKIMNMYNSNNYLPNEKYDNKELTNGFQILTNPTSVSNPNLIPVLRAMPVSSTLGSKRNSSWDLRGDVPNPKTVVAPWNNSSINPDIYSSNRGCL